MTEQTPDLAAIVARVEKAAPLDGFMRLIDVRDFNWMVAALTRQAELAVYVQHKLGCPLALSLAPQQNPTEAWLGVAKCNCGLSRLARPAAQRG
ncbi:MAG: hypothetical protein DLM66_00220 [Candidatus Dormiibacter spiritus]|nr:MAG: hypothetical protein DLM66_00220 [Candidatus Dormibacteraeota bacterium]